MKNECCRDSDHLVFVRRRSSVAVYRCSKCGRKLIVGTAAPGHFESFTSLLCRR